MRWVRALRSQPLRMKLAVTAVGTAVAAVGLVLHLSIGYWRQETMVVAEQQALLAAASVRSSVESALTAGEPARARRALEELVERASIDGARVYGPDRTVLVSTVRSQEGSRPAVWLPSARDLPERGVARPTGGGDAVAAFLPLRAGGAAVLAVDFSLEPLQASMERGARLGLLLLIGSLAAVILILGTMLEREVVSPIERVAGILGPAGRGRRGADELGRIEASVTDLLQRERDVEERIASQAGFAQVGEMAAEMAHEFKRPLASIRSAISLLEQEYELNDQAQGLLRAVDGQLGKLTETMQDLFALARPVEVQGAPVDLSEVLDSALAQLAGLVDTAGRRIERRYDRSAPAVLGDAHRLEQAVLNLMLNALEAMEAGGTLTVTLRGARGGAVVEVRDTGPGIPDEEVERVLLPFYSTKPGGTGLGLPLVARIVAAHGGQLEIRGRPGVGTTVRIALPAAAERAGPGEAAVGGEGRQGGQGNEVVRGEGAGGAGGGWSARAS